MKKRKNRSYTYEFRREAMALITAQMLGVRSFILPWLNLSEYPAFIRNRNSFLSIFEPAVPLVKDPVKRDLTSPHLFCSKENV